jgi:hypothetical protein
MSLAKATLWEIAAGTNPEPKNPFVVQFNPESLKLALANKVEGGQSKGKQRRQYLGKTSTALTFDLHFDTADEGTTDAPVSVRTKTRGIERYVLPQGEGNQKQAPPKVRFQWGKLIVDGIIEDVSIDFDLFAENGTPLRAKVAVSIKEQDAKWQLGQQGHAANPAGSPTPPGGGGPGGTGPGSSGGGPTNRTQPALADESAADFLARQGLDPTAWRGIAGQLGDSLALTAGLEVDFDASLSASVGLGLSVGIEAGIGVSLEASFGLEVGAELGISAGFSAEASAGFALSAAGGLSAALETVAAVQAEASATDARRAFGPAAPPAAQPVSSNALPAARGAAALSGASRAVLAAPAGLPAPATTPRPAPPEQARPSLARHGFASRSEGASAPPAPPPPLADPRSTTFGRGVPLRPRVAGGADLRQAEAASRIPLRPYERPTDALDAARPGDAPWVRLPRRGRRAERGAQPSRGCGCGGACGGGRH